MLVRVRVHRAGLARLKSLEADNLLHTILPGRTDAKAARLVRTRCRGVGSIAASQTRGGAGVGEEPLRALEARAGAGCRLVGPPRTHAAGLQATATRVRARRTLRPLRHHNRLVAADRQVNGTHVPGRALAHAGAGPKRRAAAQRSLGRSHDRLDQPPTDTLRGAKLPILVGAEADQVGSATVAIVGKDHQGVIRSHDQAHNVGGVAQRRNIQRLRGGDGSAQPHPARARAELPVKVAAKSPHFAAARQQHGRVLPRGHRRHSLVADEALRQLARHRVGPVRARLKGLVRGCGAALPPEIGAKAEEVALTGNDHAVEAPERHQHGCLHLKIIGQNAQRCRVGQVLAGVGRPAQLAVPVGAPRVEAGGSAGNGVVPPRGHAQDRLRQIHPLERRVESFDTRRRNGRPAQLPKAVRASRVEL